MTRTPIRALAAGPAGPIARLLAHPGIISRLARLALAAGIRYGPAVAGVVVAALAAGLLTRQLLGRRRHAVMTDGARLVTILAPPAASPGGAAALWAHLSGLLRPPAARLLSGQPHLAWEYSWTGGDTAGLSIRLWVPGTIPPGLIEAAVEAAWPGAHATAGKPASPLPPAVLATGGTLRLARAEVLPVSTSHDPDAPLRALAGAAAGLAAGEHAVVQVLARPVTGRRLRRARRAARAHRGGQPARPLHRLLDLLTPGPAGPARRPRGPADPELAAEVRAVTGKLAGPHWETLIRYATATTIPARPAGTTRRAARRQHAWYLPRLRGLAHALASATALYAGMNWLARRRLRRPAAAIGSRRMRGGDLLSAAELAMIARLPSDPALPGLARAGARSIPPPPAIPVPGPLVRPLGVSDAGPPRPVGLAVADARHHQRMIGPTGTGKTTLIETQIGADIAAGRGVVFIDAKGDAVTSLAGRLPGHVGAKVVLFDPGDRGAPPCLNVLQGDGTGTDTDMITDNVTGIFRRIFAASWGPRTDDIFRAACLTLIGSVPPGSGLVTLADIPPLLGDDAYRRRLAATVTDPVLRGFWDWYEQLTPASRAHSTGPLMNKLRAFLLRRFAHAAIAAGPSTFDMAGVLDHGGVLLARLPKGVLGEETAQLVGSFIVARTWQAAARRAAIPQHARPDASLYIDECQNFLNLPYPMEDMLAEARGYRLAITMAHQNLAQLPPDLRQGISANARSQIIFSVSPEDARELEHHTLPNLTAHDLSHLGAFQAAARLVAGNAETPAFTFRTRPLPPPVPGRARQIRTAARNAHSGGTRRPEPRLPDAGPDPRLSA
jgi:hypothetical protein